MKDEVLKDEILNQIKNILEKLDIIEKKELPVITKTYTYEEFSKMIGKTITETYLELVEKLDKINITELDKKINNIRELVKEYQIKCTTSWNNCNSSYKQHLKNKITNILDILNQYIPYNVENYRRAISAFFNFYDKIMNINTNKEIMESFSYINKNYVIFGKNGAGKTRLLNYIKNNYFNSNSYVIPSDREIRVGKLSNIFMDYPEKHPLSNLFHDAYVYPNDILTLFLKDKILIELQSEADSFLDGNNARIAKSYHKFLEIFNNLGLDRKINFDFTNNKLMLYNDTLNIKPYYIADGSDGEKSIIQLILFVLLCPENSFVFIDEPESHFNTALLNELFSLLEKERKDIVFIYCTHNVDFIELRANAQLIYLEKFDGNNWKIEEINSFDDISIENIINIVGTKKNILFIESEKGKMDYRFYNSLFTNFKIIPVSSCENVINSCKALNDLNYLNLNRRAYGIIDNDFHTPSEVAKYERSKIFTLPYNEIENLLLSPIILDYICNKYELTDKLEDFKNNIINMADRDKKGITKDYINKTYPKIQKSGHILSDDIENIKNEIEQINTENTNNFINELNQFVSSLNTALNNRDYNEIICKYPNKGFVSCLKTLGITKEVYFQWINNSLSEDESFRKNVINIFFGNFFD